MSIYCVYLTIYQGNKLPPFYIGSSSVKKVNEGYHGSVSSRQFKKIWEQELKENPDLFKTKIISKHSDRKEATRKENILQKHVRAVKNPLYINLSYAAFDSFSDRDQTGKNNPMFGSCRKGKDNPFYGKHHTEETRVRLKKDKNLRMSRLTDTLNKKYGVSNINQLDWVKAKSKKTNLEKYGADNYAKSDQGRDQISKLRKQNAERPIYQEIKKLYHLLNMKIPSGTYIQSDDKLASIREELSDKLQSSLLVQ